MNTRIVLLVAMLSAIAIFFYVDGQQFLSLATLKAQQTQLTEFYNAHQVQALAGYALLYIIVTALSLPGATILTLAGGAIFGLFWGTVIVSFASTIGASLAFLSARFLLRDWVQSRFAEQLTTINEGIERDGEYYLFTLRLVPLFPFFMINLLMGLTTLKTRTFYGVSQLGMLAGTLVYVNAGTQLGKLESLSGILSPLLVGSFVLLGLFPLLAKKIIENFPHE
ncbi:MAG: TVP38/TMEM64 family protein [Methylococcales bacterium]|nr:TVP38/TMEM64 family protein [Methylococcales bacterium]